MRRDLAALALILLLAGLADARVAQRSDSPMRLAPALPLVLVAGSAATTVGANQTSAETHANDALAPPRKLLTLESRSQEAQFVWLRVEPTSALGRGTVILHIEDQPQILIAAGIPLKTEGVPVALAPHAKLVVSGHAERALHARLVISILSHPAGDAGQTLRETWTVIS